MIDILKNKKYKVFLITDFFSVIGDGLFYIALMTFARSISDNGYAITLVSISENLPLLFTFFTGLVADSSANKYRDLRNVFFTKSVIYLIVALIMGFSPSITFLIIICILNFCSDCLGRMAVGMSSVVPQIVFEEKQWEDSSGLYAINQQVAQIISQSLGGFLILYYSFKGVALINVAIFLFVFIYFIFNKKIISEIFYSSKNKDAIVYQEKKSIKNELVDFFKLRKNAVYSKLFQSIISITLLNSILATIPSVLSIAFTNFKTTLDYSIFLTFLLSGNTISVILGSSLGIKITKGKELSRYLLYSLLITIGFFLSISVNQLFISLIMSWILYFNIGIINPKLNALFRKTIPVKEYAKITGAFGSLMSIGSVLGSIVYNLAASKNITIFTILMVLLLIVYSIYNIIDLLAEKKGK